MSQPKLSAASSPASHHGLSLLILGSPTALLLSTVHLSRNWKWLEVPVSVLVLLEKPVNLFSPWALVFATTSNVGRRSFFITTGHMGLG